MTVARKGKVLGKFSLLQLPSLIETGYLSEDDHYLDAVTGDWIPLKDCLGDIPGYARRSSRKISAPPQKEIPPGLKPFRVPPTFWIAGLAALLLAAGASVWAWIQWNEAAALRLRLAAAETTNREWKEKYHQILFAAREVAAHDLVRGRVIARNASGKRVVLPGIKVRLYTRAEIESHLAERNRTANQAGTDPISLAAHFLKNLPNPIELSTSDSDGRFEMKIPSPGEYVIQTSIRSAKTGQMKLWFVAFDSRDPLNTPVDITESNSAQQFNPLLMVVEGR